MNWPPTGPEWVDLSAGLVVIVSALFGYGRGLVRELLGLGTWAGALRLAARWTAPVERVLAPHLGNPLLANTLGFALPFIGLLIVFTLVAQACGRIVRDSLLGGLNSMLGLLFGGLRGYGLLVVAYLLASLVSAPSDWPAPVHMARVTPLVEQGAFLLRRCLPIFLQPKLA
ncbi:CvpA family protein [Nguyenibacter vanlangensis]|uniref:CvpA family protein n=1 Tax=Nguyenibacter vanlangensis TaxID=1216886 RepID=UPI001FE88C00|nr:CvpA family protein [Nguyenibacter vanlangensis]